jgi:hypothetical protein
MASRVEKVLTDTNDLETVDEGEKGESLSRQQAKYNTKRNKNSYR